jgi:hypothetical protein
MIVPANRTQASTGAQSRRMATPRNASDDKFALRGKFTPVLRLSLIGRILLPVRRTEFPVRLRREFVSK